MVVAEESEYGVLLRPAAVVPVEIYSSERKAEFLLTSGYAVEEARRNLNTSDRRSRLEDLLAAIHVGSEAPQEPLPPGVRLTLNDEPILRAAIAAGATHLLTGDLRDFGHLMGRRVGGVRIQTPGDFLRSR